MTEPDGEPPPYSFAQLITQAIASTSDRQMTLKGIYGFIRCNYPWYRTCDKGWMNSIRYNLAFRPEFINAPCKPGEIGFGWRMDPSCEDRFIKCAFKKPERIAGTSSEYLDITSSQEKVSNVDQTNAIHSLESMVSNIGIQPNVTCSNSGNLSGTEIKTEPIEGGAASAIEVVEESGAIEIKIEPIEGGAASAIEVVEESGAIDTRTSNYCENCHTLTTGHWRNVDGKRLCNACGQYFVLHGKDRPAHFFTECIRKRPRNGSTVHNRNPINQSIDASQYTVRYRAIAPAPPPLVHPTRNPINQSIDVSQYTQTYPQHLCYRRIAPAPPPLHPTRIPINQSIYANQYTQTLYPQHLPYVPIPPTPPPLYPTRNLILENRFRDLKLENEEMKQQLFLKDRQFSEVNNKQQKLIEEHRSKFKDYEQLVKADLESLKLILNDPQSFKSIVVLPKESLMRVFNEFQMIKTDFTALKTAVMKMPSELKDLRIKLDQIALSGKTLTSTHHAVVECNEELSKSTLSRTAEIHNLTFEMLRKDFLKEQSVREKVCHLNRQLKVTLKDIQQGSRKRKSRQTDGESDKKKAKKKQLSVAKDLSKRTSLCKLTTKLKEAHDKRFASLDKEKWWTLDSDGIIVVTPTASHTFCLTTTLKERVESRLAEFEKTKHVSLLAKHDKIGVNKKLIKTRRRELENMLIKDLSKLINSRGQEEVERIETFLAHCCMKPARAGGAGDGVVRGGFIEKKMVLVPQRARELNSTLEPGP